MGPPLTILRDMHGKKLAEAEDGDLDSVSAVARAKTRELLSRFGRDDIACTLDFIETTEGMMLLEAGPPHTPLGGGHPAAFAGYQVTDHSVDRESRCVGVALRCMDHVDLGNPRSWIHGDHPTILTFDEARQLAGYSENPAP